jgi:hypothetical protein
MAASLLAPASSVTAASIWTPVESGTTHDITGIEYQSADRFWYVTGTGEVFKRRPDGSFDLRYGPSSLPLNDIEFQIGGQIGFAVGNGGQVLRSVDAGETWASVNTGGQPIPVSESTNFPQCDTTQPLADVNSVRFAGNNRVYIFAQGAQLARSQPGNPADVGAAGTWTDANRDTKGTASTADDTCKVPPGAGGMDDGFFVPTTPDVGYICTGYFGKVYLTSDNLASAASERPANCGNGSGPDRHMTGDPDNPNRMWAVNPQGADRGFTRYTEDGWQTSFPFKIGNPEERSFSSPYDVDFSGGTVVAVGSDGLIINSVNGRKFFYNGASGDLAQTEWRAVGLATATEGAVGGVGGKLVVSSNTTKVDLDPPETTITKGPAATTRDRTPTFKFTSDESGATFKCKLNQAPFFKSCTSPKTVKKLRYGTHVFKVKAKDKAGNVDPTPAKKVFKVVRRR